MVKRDALLWLILFLSSSTDSFHISFFGARYVHRCLLHCPKSRQGCPRNGIVRQLKHVLVDSSRVTNLEENDRCAAFFLSVEDLLTSQGFLWNSAIENQELLVEGNPVQSSKELVLVRDGLNVSYCGIEFQFHEAVYLALNKPVGYECSRDPQTGNPSVYNLLPLRFRRRGVQCAGRLDCGTSGLLLFSDDTRFLHHLTNPAAESKLLKYYRAECISTITDNQVRSLCDGVRLRGANGTMETKVRVGSNVEREGQRVLHLAISEGAFHQVKRMISAVGNKVKSLHRSQIGALQLSTADLKPGQWRYLTTTEIQSLLGYNLSDAIGIRRYIAQNCTFGAIRRKYSSLSPNESASQGSEVGGGRSAAVDFVAQYLRQHGDAPVAVLGNELGKQQIKFSGRLAQLLATARRKGRLVFAVGPDQVVTLRPGEARRPPRSSEDGAGTDEA